MNDLTDSQLSPTHFRLRSQMARSKRLDFAWQSFRLASLCCAFNAIAGCRATPIQKVSFALDRMSYAEAEFGTMGISSPVIAAPDSNFSYDLNTNADTFYSDALKSRQGSVSELSQSALSAGLGVNATFDPAAGGAFVAQLQQYQQAVASNGDAAKLTNLKNSLQNASAWTQYQADVQSANALADPIAKQSALATAQSKLAAAMVVPATNTLPQYPTAATAPAASTNIVSRPTDLLKQFANSGNFAGFQNLAASPSPLGITDRTAILTSAGDNETKAIFKLFGNPELAQKFNDKQYLLGACTVSVQPGWRTQRGFAADVKVVCQYEFVDARPRVIEQFIKDPGVPLRLRERLRQQIEGNAPDTELGRLDEFEIDPKKWNEQHFGPHVAVISPLTDTQTLDLQSSDRREQDVALSLTVAAQLAAAGFGGQAQTFLNYAESLQKDVATISPDVVVSAYSSGAMFGFQVGPRLKAVAEEKEGKASGPAEILDRQSFPALVLYTIEKGAYFPRVHWNAEEKRYDLFEPALNFDCENSWAPARSRAWYENVTFLNFLGPLFFIDRTPQARASDILSLSYDANLAIDQQTASAKKSSDSAEKRANETAMGLMKAQLLALKTELFGGVSEIYIPAQYLRIGASPVVSDVQPSAVPAGELTQLAILGSDLDDIDLTKISCVVGGVPSSVSNSPNPFGATRRNGTLFLQIIPDIFATHPSRTLLQDDASAAESNLGQVSSYISGVSSELTSLDGSLIKNFADPLMPADLNTNPIDWPLVKKDLPNLEAALGCDAANVAIARIWGHYLGTLSNAEKIKLAGQALSELDALTRSVALLTPTPTMTATQINVLQTQKNYLTKKIYATKMADPSTEINLATKTLDDILPGAVPADKALTDLKAKVAAISTLQIAGVFADKWADILAHPWTDEQSDRLKSFVEMLKTAKSGLAPTISHDIDLIDSAYGSLPPGVEDSRQRLSADDSKPFSAVIANLQSDLQAQGKLTAQVQTQLQSVLSAYSAANKPFPNANQLLALEKAVSSTSAALNAKNSQLSDSRTLAQANLDQAKAIVAGLQAASVKTGTDPATPVSSSMSTDSTTTAAIAQATANLTIAQANWAQAQNNDEQKIVFALPSIADPSRIVYTPAVAVRQTDPCNLVVAPKVIQLQASASTGSSSAAASTGTSAIGSGTSNSSPPPVTVLIAGDNLDRVDLANITSIPASKTPLAARMAGSSIAVDLSVTSSDSAICFDLPIIGSTRQVVTPPITVKAAPTSANGVTTPSGNIPTVNLVSPSTLELAKDSQGNPVPNFSVPFVIVGTNMDQVDLSSLTIVGGSSALIDPTVANQPILVGGSIKVTLIVKDANSPVVIGLPVRGVKGQVVNTLPLNVTLQK